jgi:oligopeptide transport system substrate-binding protein
VRTAREEGSEPGSSRVQRIAITAAIAVLVAVVGWAVPQQPAIPIGRAANDQVHVAGVLPASLDPALAGDVQTGAVVANLYEGLTDLDPELAVRPALAASWEADPQWQHIVFHLRPGLTFSDGSALGPEDVVRSWLRVLDPRHPSPLAGLLSDVQGAPEYLTGQSTDQAAVGIKALPGVVDVRLRRPSPWFIAATSSPALAVVPPGIDPDGATTRPGSFVGSGGYVLSSVDSSGLALTANPHYWAGPPAIARATVVTGTAGGPLAGFRDGSVDYTAIPDQEATWIRYDRTLGPALREEPPLTVEYFGFDTTRPPFNDVRVRQAFAEAVDWRSLAGVVGGGDEPANSLVPPGVPGRSALDLLPKYDPAGARALLAAAGYAGGAGFPDIALQTDGSPYDSVVRASISRELGVKLRSEILSDFLDRMLGTDRPAMWALSWIADYPDPFDFLGVLLESGQTSNFGRWKDPAFDAALQGAATAASPADRAAAYAAAERIVADQAPIIPVAYPTEWALSRDGLLGAHSGGVGIIRFDWLAWAGS